VSTGFASPTSPSRTNFAWPSGTKLPIHLMRSGSILSASIRLPKCALLALLKADLMSMNRAPATYFSPMQFIRTAGVGCTSKERTHAQGWAHPSIPSWPHPERQISPEYRATTADFLEISFCEKLSRNF